MAVTTYKNQGAIYPLLSHAVIGYRGIKNPIPTMSPGATVIVASGNSGSLYAKNYWRHSTTDPYPIMQPGATVPIGLGMHMIPVKPLPGGGGGSGASTVGYGI